ncbi:hypothetical protein LZ578_08790 [Jeotgalibaca sp. MA1X17-3]|uniref:hypothetical protein n=1 Tax=Jeotgalibaca sp. MA1X17-3 TaxID=2908211 RepID=UPI001F18F906|nr:hypothetical protein [Jeotgalibaca sp. MA1X17-3]UJF15094.1 hypothetical protein LZ578_08790 [Jeotgalibaca sp. MA1X17-3]
MKKETKKNKKEKQEPKVTIIMKNGEIRDTTVGLKCPLEVIERIYERNGWN